MVVLILWTASKKTNKSTAKKEGECKQYIILLKVSIFFRGLLLAVRLAL